MILHKGVSYFKKYTNFGMDLLNLRSYLLMRAVGLDTGGMRRLIFRQNMKNVLLGLLIGGVISFAACIAPVRAIERSSIVEKLHEVDY
jgi:hypothetical protein